MCGIFGYSMKKDTLSESKRAVLATTLAFYNDFRGKDSWGVVGIDSKGAHIKKGLGLLHINAHKMCGYKHLFAHTRFGTIGTNTIKNAHPFKVGKIIGAHNGMIFNHYPLLNKYDRNFAVDSQHIFAHLDEGLPLDELVGYGSIEWVNKEESNKIYLAKLRNGDLAVYGIGTYEDVQGIVWSSVADHAKRALSSAGIDQKNYFAYEINEDVAYVVNDGEIGISNIKVSLSASPPVVDNSKHIRMPGDKVFDNEDAWPDGTGFFGNRMRRTM